MQVSKTALFLLELCVLMHLSCSTVEKDDPFDYTGTWICNSPDSATSLYDTLLLNDDGTFSRSERVIFHTMDIVPYEMSHWGKFDIANDSITYSIDSAKTCRACERYDLTYAVIRIRRQRFQTISIDSIITVPFFRDQKFDTHFGYRREK